jgi:hypothetical protein
MGHLLAGTYEMRTTVGTGPTGTVWRAENRRTREPVAVKFLDARFAGDPVAVDRLRREERILAAHLHQNLVRVRELVVEGTEVALVTEFAPGTDLRRQLRDRSTFDLATAGRIAVVCAEALAAAHLKGVVHCGIKPSNVVLPDDPAELRITDCRLARLVRGYPGERFVDPEYATPEAIQGAPAVPASDVYGIGLVLYELLTGVPLCHGDDPAQVLAQHLRPRRVAQAGLPRPVRDLLDDCLALDPAGRPSAAEVADDLRHLLPGARMVPDQRVVPGWRAPEVSAGPETGDAEPGQPAVLAGPTVHDRVEPTVHSRQKRPERPEPRLPEIRLGSRHIRLTGRPLFIAGAVLLLVAIIGVGIANLPRDPGAQSAATEVNAGGGGPGSLDDPPRLNSAARAYTMEGASAFVQYWFAALNYATATGNTGPFTDASDPACAACATVLRVVQSGYQNGGHLEGGGYTLRSVQTDAFFDLNLPTLNVVYDRLPRTAIGPDGQRIQTVPAVTFAVGQVSLVRVSDQWRVRELISSRPVG